MIFSWEPGIEKLQVKTREMQIKCGLYAIIIYHHLFISRDKCTILMLGKLGVGYMGNSLWYHYNIAVNLKFTEIRHPPKKKI